MSLNLQSVVTKKSFVILARFLVLGTICAMTQMAHAWDRFSLVTIVVIFGATNLFLIFQPAVAFEHHRFSSWIFGFDTLTISLFIFFLSGSATELYLAYFLTIFIAAIARSAPAALATSIVSCAIYALLTLYGRTGVDLYSSSFAIRVAFFIATAVFVGYLAEEARHEREERYVAQGLVRMNSRLAVLFDISTKLIATMSLTELHREIIEGAVRSIEADAGSLMIREENSNTLRVEAAVGVGAEELKGYTLKVGERIAGRVAAEGNGILLQEGMPAHPQFASYASPRGIRSSICAPLRIGDRILGVININRITQKELFQSEDLALLGTFCIHAALIIDRARLYRHAEEMSKMDRLLDIYNRGAFDERLQEEMHRAKRYGRTLGLIILDLDGFKAYNDHHGHQAGDEVLRKVAGAIKSSVRKTDIVARYGGDEIAVILPETPLDRAVQAAERAKEVTAGLKIPFEADGRSEVITLSGGVAVFNPTDNITAEELVKRADAALYKAKNQGRNKVVAV
jgi:diguanylate cyclase (GGDEF)-like protein